MGSAGRATMMIKIWFQDSTNGVYAAESQMDAEHLYNIWQAWRSGFITSPRLNVTIGRYPRSIRIEEMLADRTFQGLIEQNFQQPRGEMSSWPPEAA